MKILFTSNGCLGHTFVDFLIESANFRKRVLIVLWAGDAAGLVLKIEAVEDERGLACEGIAT